MNGGPETIVAKPTIMETVTPTTNGFVKPQYLEKLSQLEYQNGPDQVFPAKDVNNCFPGGHVKLRMSSVGTGSVGPVSVPGLLRRAVIKHPDHHAFAHKSNGKWIKTTFREYSRQVHVAAKAFLKLGLERYHSVCILGFNSPEWFIGDMAAIHAGGYVAGVYTTNSAESCFYCLESSRANVVLVQDRKQLAKILEYRAKLPLLKAIIQWEGTVDPSIPGLYTWAQMMAIGENEPDAPLEYILKTMAVNECCTLVYTSGTVGQPKAVMLSHDNLTWDAFAISERLGQLDPSREKIISFLPLSHVAAQIVDIYLTLTNNVTVYFAQPDALKGSLVDTLKDVRPTRFLGVPRVWEKIHEKMMAVAASNGALKTCIASWAKQRGLNHNIDKMNGIEDESTCYKLARSLILIKVKEALGLDNCNTFVTAAAPLSPDIKRYFLSLDIPITDAFGMSEAAGAHTLSIPTKFTLESSGEILPGVETMFKDALSPAGPGEICMRGRHVFMGYLNDPEKTNAAMTEDGWLMSGDVGKVDSRNFLYITGRIKELLITAGGENVAPVLIEQNVMAELQYLGNAVVIGDRRKFLSILVTLRSEVDKDTAAPLDELEKETKRWVSSLGSNATRVSQVISTKDPKIYKAIEDGIKRANKKAISNAQKVQKFAILPADLSVHTGELGPTMKLKRNVIHDKYKDIIEELYKD